jgi:hypothetical protein
MQYERLERLTYLRDKCDHCIMPSAFVLECGRIFGCTLKPYTIHASLLDNPNGDDQGMGAESIVEDVCRHYKVPYAAKYGRGSQLRECCEQLLVFFASPEAPPPRAKSTWTGTTRSAAKKKK